MENNKTPLTARQLRTVLDAVPDNYAVTVVIDGVKRPVSVYYHEITGLTLTPIDW